MTAGLVERITTAPPERWVSFKLHFYWSILADTIPLHSPCNDACFEQKPEQTAPIDQRLLQRSQVSPSIRIPQTIPCR